MSIEDVYRNLTGVNIKEQETLWNERGKGYYGEYLVFSALFNGTSGAGKFLMNLEVPKEHGGTTEIDLLFIHETGIYVFEIKHYKGIIYGSEDQQNWVQYFRTVKNNAFYNPILQNDGHIKALRYNLPDETLYSYVVFTNADCDLRVTGSTRVMVIRLANLVAHFNSLVANKPQINSKEHISALYEQLLPYSKVVNATVPVNDDNMPFYGFIDMFRKERSDQLAMFDDKKAALETDYKSRKKQHLLLCFAGIAAAALVAFVVAKGFIDNYKRLAQEAETARISAEADREEMQKHFSHVEPWNNGEFDFNYEIVTPEIVLFEDSKEIADAVELQVNLVAHSSEYGLSFARQNAKYTVQLKNGTVKEFDVYANGLGNYGNLLIENNSWYSPIQELPKITLIGVKTEEIDYIKLGSFELFYQYKSGTALKSGIELEVYSR